jgi:hypothetical protein
MDHPLLDVDIVPETDRKTQTRNPYKAKRHLLEVV